MPQKYYSDLHVPGWFPFRSNSHWLLLCAAESCQKQHGPVNLFANMDSLIDLAQFFGSWQRYTYRVLQTIQIELILLCVWAEPAILSSTRTALKFKYEI